MDWEGEGKIMPDFDKIERGHGHDKVEELPDWARRQERVFTNWINNKVEPRNLRVTNLFQDLTDGCVLYALLEVLSKQSLAVLGKVRPEKNRIRKIDNMNIVWQYLSTTVRMVGIGAMDIVDGNATLTLGMIWSLILFFMAKDLGGSATDVAAMKKKIMEWMKTITRNHPDVHVHNFTSCLADGKAFLAMLNSVNPKECPYNPSEDAATNLKKAFQDASRLYGVGSILDANDPSCCADEKANLTYLAELMKAFPALDTVKPPVDPKQAALDYANEHTDDTINNLKALCKYKPEDNTGAAAKVADLMTSAGLVNVTTIPPLGDNQDPSFCGAPFVIGEKKGPEGSPEVLFYATYGTAEDDEAAAKDWASDPFLAEIKNGKLIAKGAAGDKYSVVAPLAAITAMLQSPEANGLPCSVKVLVGGTPPAHTLAGDAPLQLTDKLAEFIKTHPGLIGNPALVLISDPAGCAMAPDKAAVTFCCRGFLTIDVKVTTMKTKDGQVASSIPLFGGPLVDPGYVLATIISSFRETHTGAIRIEGASAHPDPEAIQRLNTINYTESHLRPESGYLPDAPIAKETYFTDGVTLQATLPEQLMLLPAITVTNINMNNQKENGPLSAVYCSSASASLHMCIAPNQDMHTCVKALKQHCLKASPFGVDVTFDNLKGRNGWNTDPHQPIIDAIIASRQLVDSKRNPCVSAGSAGFKPIPSAFSASLPNAKVLTLGVNDTTSKMGKSNEAVQLEDLSDSVKTSIHLLHYIAYGAPSAKAPQPFGAGVAQAAAIENEDKDKKGAYANKFMSDLDKRNYAVAKEKEKAATAGTSTPPLRGTGYTSPPTSPPPPGQAVFPPVPQTGSPYASPINVRKSSFSLLAETVGSGVIHVDAKAALDNSPLPPEVTPSSPGMAQEPEQSQTSPERSSPVREPPALSGPPLGGPHSSLASAQRKPADAVSAELLEEINNMRSNPAQWSERVLVPLKTCFAKGNVFTSPYGAGPRVTLEGERALLDAISFFKSAPPQAPLTRSPDLDNAATDHASDMRTSGILGHLGSDGSKPAERIGRHGQFVAIAGEVISLYESTPLGMAVQMAISDGESTRQTRKSLLAGHFKVCGIATDWHPVASLCAVIALTGGFGPKPLNRPSNVSAGGAAGEPNAEFNRVLQSIPVPQVLAEVASSLEKGLTVSLDYHPGGVKASFARADGSTQVMTCEWGA